jgi:gamma-glutamyl phosphate reductase
VHELPAAVYQLTNRIQRRGNVLEETERREHRRFAPPLVHRAAEAPRPVLQAHEVWDLVRGVHQAHEVQDPVREVQDRVHQAHGAPLQVRQAHEEQQRVR